MTNISDFKFRTKAVIDGKEVECEGLLGIGKSHEVEGKAHELHGDYCTIIGEKPFVNEMEGDVQITRLVDDKVFCNWAMGTFMEDRVERFINKKDMGQDTELVNMTKWGWIKGAWILKNARMIPELKRHVVEADEVVDHVEMTIEFKEKIPWPWHRKLRKQITIWASMIWRALVGEREDEEIEDRNIG